jgi:hypothetical protein
MDTGGFLANGGIFTLPAARKNSQPPSVQKRERLRRMRHAHKIQLAGNEITPIADFGRFHRRIERPNPIIT